MEAEAKSLADHTGENLDPHKIWACMMSNEKPGGHGERSVAVGTIDMAVWDAVAKIANKPLFKLLAERYGNGTVNRRIFVYAAGGYYYPGKDLAALRREMKSYLDRGYTVVKMKIGGASLDEDVRRIESVLSILSPGQRLAVDANGRFNLAEAINYAKTLSPYNLFWYEEAGDPLDFQLQAELAQHYNGPMATGENLFSTTDAESYPLRRHAAGSRLASIRLRLAMGWLNIFGRWKCLKRTNGRHPAAFRMAGIRCPSILPRDWDWAGTNPIPIFSNPSVDFPTA